MTGTMTTAMTTMDMELWTLPGVITHTENTVRRHTHLVGVCPKMSPTGRKGYHLKIFEFGRNAWEIV